MCNVRLNFKRKINNGSFAEPPGVAGAANFAEDVCGAACLANLDADIADIRLRWGQFGYCIGRFGVN